MTLAMLWIGIGIAGAGGGKASLDHVHASSPTGARMRNFSSLVMDAPAFVRRRAMWCRI